MFANNNASRSSASLSIDEIRWLNASKLEAFSNDDGDSVHSLPFAELAKSHSVAIPKSSRPRYNDSRRRSILLDDFLGSNTLSRSVDSSRFGLAVLTSPTSTPPPSPEKTSPVTPPRVYSPAHLGQGRATAPEMPRLAQRPTEWLYRSPRPRSPSSLSRSPSSISSSTSSSPSSISRSPSTPSSSRSVTPTPTRIRPPTGYRPHTPTPAVAEMNQSPFWSTVAPPQRTASIRNGSPTSHRSKTPSRSSPNLLEFRGSPKPKQLCRPPVLPVQRERSGSESSSISTTSTSSLPRTPPSPSLYSQHSFTYPHPDTRSTTPTKSILTLAPKAQRSPSISTKHSSKSVKFDEVPDVRYTGDREFHIGDGRVRGEEWNSHVLDADYTSFDMDRMDLLERSGALTPTPLTKAPTGTLKRLLTLPLRARNKNKPRPEISGPYALAPSSPGHPPHTPEHAESRLSLNSGSGTMPSVPYKSRSSVASFLVQGSVGAIPSSPNGGTDTGGSPRNRPKKSSSLIGPGDLGILPDHGRFLPNKFHSHPVRASKKPKAASVAGTGSLGLMASQPVLHALPSMESFRSVRSTKSTRSCGRFKDWLGRIGIGVVA
ncbi:hypothetical protein B0H15DRAFT_330990 [Mycena belliarum]|uniref:Uncharacterized protein n=1 Tax=Mycena belliarum TaxID=1033014 RepID=A0AAD6UHC4_9AGAR|nr:hypothetical protein B0H15DRAFT_330990 [Mycena belliae]